MTPTYPFASVVPDPRNEKCAGVKRTDGSTLGCIGIPKMILYTQASTEKILLDVPLDGASLV